MLIFDEKLCPNNIQMPINQKQVLQGIILMIYSYCKYKNYMYAKFY